MELSTCEAFGIVMIIWNYRLFKCIEVVNGVFFLKILLVKLPHIWEKIFGFPLFIDRLCHLFERSFGKNFKLFLV